MAKNAPEWYCFIFDKQKTRGITEIDKFLKDTIENIFREDFYDICLIGEKFADEFEVHTDGYFFVKCSNYHKHVSNIQRSSIISIVLPNTENPTPVSQSDISLFEKTSTERYGTERKFVSGDIVEVKEGYLENLTGIVTKVDGEKCTVYFRLYTRQFTEILRANNLRYVGELYKVSSLKRSAVPTQHNFDLADVEECVRGTVRSALDESKIRRKERRRSAKEVSAT